MVQCRVQIEVEIDFVGANSFYVNDAEQVKKLNDSGRLYMFDLHSDQQVFLKELEWICFGFQSQIQENGYFSYFQTRTGENMIEYMFIKHLRVQKDIPVMVAILPLLA